MEEHRPVTDMNYRHPEHNDILSYSLSASSNSQSDSYYEEESAHRTPEDRNGDSVLSANSDFLRVSVNEARRIFCDNSDVLDRGTAANELCKNRLTNQDNDQPEITVPMCGSHKIDTRNGSSGFPTEKFRQQSVDIDSNNELSQAKTEQSGKSCISSQYAEYPNETTDSGKQYTNVKSTSGYTGRSGSTIQYNYSTPYRVVKSNGTVDTPLIDTTPNPIDLPPLSSVSLKSSVNSLFALVQSKCDDPFVWKQFCAAMEEYQKELNEKASEVDAERARRRGLEDELTATRIQLKRDQQQLREKMLKTEHQTKEQLDCRNGAEEDLRRALVRCQENKEKSDAALRKFQSDAESLIAQLGEVESDRNYIQKELDISKENCNRTTRKCELMEQELRSGKSRWAEEKQALEETHQQALSDLRNQLIAANNNADELRDDIEAERREFSEMMLSVQDRLEMTEQELERVTQENEIIAQREKDEQIKEKDTIELIQKNKEIAQLKNEIDASQQACREVESELMAIKDSIDDRLDNDRQGYVERIDEVEAELNAAVREVDILRGRLQEVEEANDVLKRDCGQLQKIIKRHEKTGDADRVTIGTLRAELTKERIHREERVESEIEARTQAFGEEMDSMIELRANERIADVRSNYERVLLKLRQQLAQVQNTRITNIRRNRHSRHESRNGDNFIHHELPSIKDVTRRQKLITTAGTAGTSDGDSHDQSIRRIPSHFRPKTNNDYYYDGSSSETDPYSDHLHSATQTHQRHKHHHYYESHNSVKQQQQQSTSVSSAYSGNWQKTELEGNKNPVTNNGVARLRSCPAEPRKKRDHRTENEGRTKYCSQDEQKLENGLNTRKDSRGKFSVVYRENPKEVRLTRDILDNLPNRVKAEQPTDIQRNKKYMKKAR